MFLQMFMEACHNILVTIQSAVKTKGGADCNAKVFQKCSVDHSGSKGQPVSVATYCEFAKTGILHADMSDQVSKELVA